MNRMVYGMMVVATLVVTGCTTTTRRYVENEDRETVAGFSEADIQYTISRVIQDILSRDRIKAPEGATRAVMIVEDVKNDTLSRGRDASALAEALGQQLREELTNSGKVIVYNKEAAQYAQVRINPQYRLAGRLSERNMRQDNKDYQKEYNLNLTLVDLATGLEFWQKRVHVGKLVDKTNVMN